MSPWARQGLHLPTEHLTSLQCNFVCMSILPAYAGAASMVQELIKTEETTDSLKLGIKPCSSAREASSLNY